MCEKYCQCNLFALVYFSIEQSSYFAIVDLHTTSQQIMDEFKILLRDKGLKATPARLEVLEILHGVEKPLSIKAILNRLSDKTINQATLYRIVTKLKEAGILSMVMLEHNHGHYQLITDKDTHHIVCTSCHTIASFHGCLFADLKESLLSSLPDFANIQSHTLELAGLCKKCFSKNAAA